MQRFVFLLMSAMALSLPAQAEQHLHKEMREDSARQGLSEGTVRKVDKAAGKVTIAHGPLENLGMPGMTMVFRVKDAAWLEWMKPGDKIRFQAERIGGIFTVVQYEPI